LNGELVWEVKKTAKEFLKMPIIGLNCSSLQHKLNIIVASVVVDDNIHKETRCGRHLLMSTLPLPCRERLGPVLSLPKDEGETPS